MTKDKTPETLRRTSAEQFLRNRAFPDRITDEEWENFKHNHVGKRWPKFTIKCLKEYAKLQASLLQKENGELKAENQRLGNRYNDISNTKAEGALLGQASQDEAYNEISELKKQLEDSLRLYNCQTHTIVLKQQLLDEMAKSLEHYIADTTDQSNWNQLNDAMKRYYQNQKEGK